MAVCHQNANKVTLQKIILIKCEKNTVIVKQLVTYAKSKKIDLIIICSSGRGKFDKVLLGSVSNEVMQKAKCPVLIIK